MTKETPAFTTMEGLMDLSHLGIGTLGNAESMIKMQGRKKAFPKNIAVK